MCQKAYTASTIQAVEAPTVQDENYDGYLMQRAAHRLALVTLEALAKTSSGKVLLLVGKGNNGADTLFAGAQIQEHGYSVEAILSEGSAHEEGLEAFQRVGGVIIDSLPSASTDYAVIIDGILGTGARGRLRGKSAEIVSALCRWLEQRERPRVIACDIPSGIDATTGQIHRPVLKADETVTFIGYKVPFLMPAEHWCGKITLDDLGLGSKMTEEHSALSRLDDAQLAEFFPTPTALDQKYSRGVVGMICGSNDYPGAALISVRAALNAGVGMVRYCGTNELNFHIHLQCPEAVCTTAPPNDLHVQAWAAGPGATGESREEALMHAILAPEPAVLDAASLELAARHIGMNGPLGAHKILTPHAGELETLLQWINSLDSQRWGEITGEEAPSRTEIEENSLYWVQVAAQLTGSTVLLKGATTLIASPDGRVLSVRGETSWMATAGSGDTLTGILGSILAQAVGKLQQQQENQSTKLDYPQDFFSHVAACAARVHNLAALAVHDGVAAGPVPPSLVAAHVPAVITQLLNAR
ncbi:MAG: NAD(P)H-hydrate epimerase [Rothia sp. (in: high G+C Gram-positive bacteria)]|nr:NAD(P)H-hydrate epimerase [Rothia sp. (in: high G+C Gram-positive bacteria)]